MVLGLGVEVAPRRTGVTDFGGSRESTGPLLPPLNPESTTGRSLRNPDRVQTSFSTYILTVVEFRVRNLR